MSQNDEILAHFPQLEGVENDDSSHSYEVFSQILDELHHQLDDVGESVDESTDAGQA
jgi:hypothetical protein